MSAPRVLIWTENYWVGGSDRFIADLLLGLDCDIDVCLAGNPLPAFDTWLGERVPWALPRVTIPVANLVDSPLARLRARLAPPAPPALAEELEPQPTASLVAVLSAAARARAAAVNVARLRDLIRRARPDAVLINNGGYPGAESCRAMSLAAKAEGVPNVVHYVHNMAYPPLWPAAAELRYDRLVDRSTDVWVTAADRASDALAAQRAIPREHIRTVHYGIPPAEPVPSGFDREGLRTKLGYAADGFGVAVVAALERRKGHEVLLRAVANVPRSVHVALVGTGPEEARLRALAAELGLGERIRFCGWREDVDDILRASDALALPSLGNECLPFAILEAMAHALPVVATDVAGIPEEVLDGVTGAVVPPGDVAALATALRRLATSQNVARAQGLAGLERQRRLFGRDRMAAEILGLLVS